MKPLPIVVRNKKQTAITWQELTFFFSTKTMFERDNKAGPKNIIQSLLFYG